MQQLFKTPATQTGTTRKSVAETPATQTRSTRKSVAKTPAYVEEDIEDDQDGETMQQLFKTPITQTGSTRKSVAKAPVYAEEGIEDNQDEQLCEKNLSPEGDSSEIPDMSTSNVEVSNTIPSIVLTQDIPETPNKQEIISSSNEILPQVISSPTVRMPGLQHSFAGEDLCDSLEKEVLLEIIESLNSPAKTIQPIPQSTDIEMDDVATAVSDVEAEYSSTIVLEKEVEVIKEKPVRSTRAKRSASTPKKSTRSTRTSSRENEKIAEPVVEKTSGRRTRRNKQIVVEEVTSAASPISLETIAEEAEESNSDAKVIF